MKKAFLKSIFNITGQPETNLLKREYSHQVIMPLIGDLLNGRVTGKILFWISARTKLLEKDYKIPFLTKNAYKRRHCAPYLFGKKTHLNVITLYLS